MSRIIRRFAAVLMITLTGYGITHAAVPAHHMATTGSGPLPDVVTVATAQG